MQDIEQVIGEALELLYGSSEDEIKGVYKIILLLSNEPDEVLANVIQNHQLIAALARLLGEDSPRPVELTFAIGKIFLLLSLSDEYHLVLSSHRVGALALGIIELECKRASHRWAESTRTGKRVPSDLSSDVSTAGKYSFSTKQERVIFVCMSILDNFADDIAVLRKMMKKSLVGVLTQCTQHESSEVFIVTISLLKKASVFKETADELSRAGYEVISRLGQHLLAPLNAAIRQDIILLFCNLSFHDGCLALISSLDVYSWIVTFLRNPLRCADTLQLIYHLSSREENQHKLYEAGLAPCLLDLMTNIPNDEKLNTALAGLLVNVSHAMINKLRMIFKRSRG